MFRGLNVARLGGHSRRPVSALEHVRANPNFQQAGGLFNPKPKALTRKARFSCCYRTLCEVNGPETLLKLANPERGPKISMMGKFQDAENDRGHETDLRSCLQDSGLVLLGLQRSMGP